MHYERLGPGVAHGRYFRHRLGCVRTGSEGLDHEAGPSRQVGAWSNPKDG